MGTENINTSVGRPGEPEPRTFSRLYQTLANPVNELDYLLSTFKRLENSSNGYRRSVLRGLCSNDVVTQALQTDLPIEAIIPMSTVADDDSAIVFLGINYHNSPPQGRNVQDLIEHRNNHKTPLEKVRSIPSEFGLTNQLNENDTDNLFALWERFGWDREQIGNFIQSFGSGQKDLWFSGIRNNMGGLVAASTAEAMEFAGIKYIETTEYSTLGGYENRGLCTATVAGLVAQVLNCQQPLTTVITAEFNTSSTSAAIGASAGFIIPKIEGVSQILSYNVAVVDGARSNSIFENQPNADRGIPFSFLRDFAVAVLPRKNIENLYTPNVVEQITNLYT
ncbi:MAG: hypothetical protein ACD_12C00848G0007 [uncultured bacterium]|nr:MAG: hypothetical protein ACD_12C00848G0007 [uncultured bacterium]